MTGLTVSFGVLSAALLDGAVSPVLAGGMVSIFSLLFFVIAFLGWLWNVVNGNQNVPPGQGRANPAQPGGRKVEKDLQAEINRFLKNVMGQEQGVDDLEEIEEKPRQRQRSKRRGDRAPKAAQEPAIVEEDSTQQGPRPGGRIASRKGPGSTTLGSGVRKHVQEHMQEGRVTRQAQEHMAHGVAEKVEHDLGQFSTAPLSDATQRTSTASVIAESAPTATALGVTGIVRNPATMKQAFVMNLILTRPTFGRDRRR